jgi:hypothetical protein
VPKRIDQMHVFARSRLHDCRAHRLVLEFAGPGTDSHFNRARLIVVGLVVRVKRGFSAAMGCFARLSSYSRAGADAGVVARGQSGAGASKPGGVHRRAATVVAQVRRWPKS